MSNASSDSDGSNSEFITPRRQNKRSRETPPSDNPKRSVPAHVRNTVLYGKKFSPTSTANKFASLKVQTDSEHSDNNSEDSPQNLSNSTISDPDTTPKSMAAAMETGGNQADPTLKDVFDAIMQTRNELAKLTNDQAQTFAIHEQHITEAKNKVSINT